MGRQRRFFHNYEYVFLAYFLYTSVLALLLPVAGRVRFPTLGVNALVIGGLALVVYAHNLRGRVLLGRMRHWYALPLILLSYREMGWFALPHSGTALEQVWIRWDRLLLNDWGLKPLIEALGPVGPATLEISYSLVYAMVPFGLGTLYLFRREARASTYLFQATLGLLLAYALFPYFPSDPPWTVFPGEDFPAYGSIFRQFNGALLAGHGIRTSVFPSAHVSGAFSAAFALLRVLPERRWVGRLNLVLAVLIATATVYGRYHYAVDAVAGFGIAVVVALICRRQAVEWREA